MRVKRQKKNRRTVRFFTVCFGFRQPFKVLCDGIFVHHLVSKEITPADAAVSELLGGPVKLFTTRCVLAELQKLGKDYSESLEAAQMLSTATCEHEEAKPADECLSEVIGIKNSEHFFLGTQDFEFRKKASAAKDSERKRLTMTNVEKRMLEKQTARILASNRAEGTVEDEQWETPRVVSTRNGLGVKDKPQFKRNRAKGPNPLSCMKKKKVNDTIPRGLNLNPKLNIKLVDKRKRTGESGLKKRTRKRSKKGKSGQEITE
ncbi:hypothetical protein DY000_02029544 [Brassica cretica]|uniref:UTP23 sensor motif region domain-containing protein n=1 Tax=Brassica cretica TaxID=69181 RepID=A0ABQ7DXY2_BRACR|nr:hypothetical protein DY000_02029544 [Brassica cretica]